MMFFYLFLLVTGTAIGSFLNVLIDRLPNDQSILGRSHCDYCKKQIKNRDLIPVLSFFLIGGHCRSCKKKLSYYYPFIELLTGVMFVLTWQFLGTGLVEKLSYLGIVTSLIVVFFADLKYQIIPDSIQVAFFIFSLGLRLSQGVTPVTFLHQWLDGFFIMVPIMFLYLITKGRGMGFGDVKLAFTIGLLLGVKSGILALYFAFILGALAGVILLILKIKKMRSKIAFGPFLVLGVLIVVFFKSYFFFIIKNIYGI